jgi:hypothetical protein
MLRDFHFPSLISISANVIIADGKKGSNDIHHKLKGGSSASVKKSVLMKSYFLSTYRERNSLLQLYY